MLHKRLLAILSTAVLAMTAVPMIPAAAADETPPASQSAEEEAIRRIFEPGFDWERYERISLSVSAPTLTAADSFSGIRGTLSEPDTAFYIVTDWVGTRPAPDTEPLGTVQIERCQYDIYRCEAGKSSIHPNNTCTEYWSVPVEKPETAQSTIHLSDHFAAWTKLGLPTGRFDYFNSFVSEKLEKGGWSVAEPEDGGFAPYFETAKPEQQPVRIKYGDMSDGFDWELYQLPEEGNAWIAPNAANGFTASWSDIPAGGRTVLDCSIRCETEIDYPDSRKAIQYDYSAAADITGNAYIGIVAFLTDEQGSFKQQTEVHIIDAWGEKRPEFDSKCGETMIGDIKYDIYKTKINMLVGGTNENVERTQFWIVRTENQKPKDPNTTYSASHNVSELLYDLLEYGLDAPMLWIIGLSAEVGDGSGTVTFTENTPRFGSIGTSAVAEKQQTAVKDIFGRLLTVGKEIIADDLPSADQPAQKSYLLENYEIASFENLITPKTCLKGDWKPGEPLEVDFTLFHNYLKFCEENQIPVVIGPFVAPRSLPTLEYYQDETGKDLAPEKMNERFEEIIKLTFNALKESYPDLKISGAIVSSQILAEPFNSPSPNYLHEVYGKDNFDFLPEIYASARKYAPNITALYMEEDFSTELGFIDDFAAVADNIRKENDCIDGTALAVSIYEPDSWTEAVSKSFCTAVTKLDKLDMKLILSDVYVSCREPYNDTVRSAGYQILFRDILSVHDKIDAVLLHDCTQYLDGAHPLANTRGFTEALSSAASKYGKQEPSATKNGDVNCDDAIDVSDAVLLARYVTEDRSAQINDQGRANADADGNGKVEADDVIHILRIIAKLI